jgi:ParB/RepB/Spo0J family partition protein
LKMEKPNQNTAQNVLLKFVSAFTIGPPIVTAKNIIGKLKPEIVSEENQSSFLMIQNVVRMLNGAMTFTPTLGFVIPNVEEENALLYLAEADIEDGGPQPRIEIRPDDPETISLFESIMKKGQLVPIDVYPSPIASNKYRIDDGHRRRMVIFNMLRKDGIWAICKQKSELEAYEDAFTLNYQRESLTDYELGQHLSLMFEKNPNITQTALGKKFGVSQQRVSQLLRCFREIERQKQNGNITTQVVMEKVSERTIRAIKNAPEDLKPIIMKESIEKNLSSRDTERLISEITAIPDATAATVTEKAQQIVEEKAKAFVEEGAKIRRKSDKLLDKLIEEVRARPPEAWVKELYGRVGENKINVENASAFASVWFGVAYEILRQKGLLEFSFEETDKW